MTNTAFKTTEYAPAERADKERVFQEASLLQETPLLELMLDAIPDIALVLNRQRQIVLANQTFIEMLNIADRQAIYGVRLGEAVDCIHSDKHPGGCGTSAYCRVCGTVKAIISGLNGEQKAYDCQLTQKSGNAFDFRVTATPFKVGKESFVIIVVADISHENRRRLLERIFFHDIINTLSSVVVFTDLLQDNSLPEKVEIIKHLSLSVQHLSDEINRQKALLDAENGNLCVNPAPIRSVEFLQKNIDIQNQHAPKTVRVHMDESSDDILFSSDPTLLSRVIGNMLTNAVEASMLAEKVWAGCQAEGKHHICFWVRNAQFIPPEIQIQVFNRSFSTKGEGRGVGTYSIKLLTEEYLNGKASFTSSPEKGTVFRVVLPLAPD